jgi:DNA-binding transcriptional MerR regulator
MGSNVTGYSISQVAEIATVSVHTLRYYERAGLMITPLERSQATHRVYGDRDLRWVIFLTKLRSTGMGIEQIRRYVELARQGEPTNEARLQLLVEHQEKVKQQLKETQTSLDAISHKIAEYSRKVANI